MSHAKRCAGPGIAGRRDEIVTSFCESVTPRCEPRISRRARLDTKDVGEAMAPASGFQPSGGRRSGAGAAPVFLILLAVACGDDGPRQTPPPAAPAKSRAAADPADGVATAYDGPAPWFGAALLAELTGDEAAARAGFEHLLGATDAPPQLAARAALHLAQFEARAGRSHRALDLVAHAAALAPSDVAVAEGIAQLRADIVAASGAGDSHGPRVGFVLAGVDAKAADAFAAAERALAAVRRFHPRPFEVLLGATEDATEDVVAKYRALAERGGLVKIAADYRIGSLYHDLAYGLLSEAPLDPTVAAGLRRQLRERALAYLRRAITAYEACLAGATSPDAELWRLAAETDLRGAREVLGEAGGASP